MNVPSSSERVGGRLTVPGGGFYHATKHAPRRSRTLCATRSGFGIYAGHALPCTPSASVFLGLRRIVRDRAWDRMLRSTYPRPR